MHHAAAIAHAVVLAIFLAVIALDYRRNGHRLLGATALWFVIITPVAFARAEVAGLTREQALWALTATMASIVLATSGRPSRLFSVPGQPIPTQVSRARRRWAAVWIPACLAAVWFG